MFGYVMHGAQQWCTWVIVTWNLILLFFYQLIPKTDPMHQISRTTTTTTTWRKHSQFTFTRVHTCTMDTVIAIYMKIETKKWQKCEQANKQHKNNQNKNIGSLNLRRERHGEQQKTKSTRNVEKEEKKKLSLPPWPPTVGWQPIQCMNFNENSFFFCFFNSLSACWILSRKTKKMKPQSIEIISWVEKHWSFLIGGPVNSIDHFKIANITEEN